MNVKFLINSLGGGGAEKVLVELSRLIKYEKCFLLEQDLKYNIPKNKIEILTSHTVNTNPIFKTLYIPKYVAKLKGKINKNDIVVSFLERSNFINIISKKIYGNKAIITVHNNLNVSNTGIKSFNNFLIKLFYPQADLVVAVSEGVKDSLVKLKVPYDKIKVIYNPISVEEIKKKAQEHIENELRNLPFLINVGRLTHQKGQWYLIRIFKEIKKYFPELKLYILGDGELKNYLVNLSESLSLKTYVWDRDKLSSRYDVYFLGFKENPYKYITKAKLFLLTSLWEGFPMVVIESLACGVPIVSSDCKSGPREALATNTNYKNLRSPEFAEYGILMPTFENKFTKGNESLLEVENIWKNTLVEILNNEAILHSYAEKSKNRAAKFDIKEIAKVWESLINDIK